MHVSNFEGVAGSEDFACAPLPTTPFDFQGKVEKFCHPTLQKIRFKIGVTPLLEEGQSQNYSASINSNGLLTQGPIGTIIIFRQCVSQKHGFLFLEKF